MSTKIAKRGFLFKTSFFYGWIIVFMGTLGLFFSGPGQTFSISIFIDFYIENFGWNRSMVSGLYSLGTLIAGFLLPIVGRQIDKIGSRKMVVIVTTFLSITCLLMSFVTNPAMLFVGFLFLRLFGQGSMTLIPHSLIPQWFVKRRGLALCLMGLGAVAGSATFPPINNWLTINYGISFAWRVWALILIGFMVPLCWIFVRNKPEDIGLVPDGDCFDKKIEEGSKEAVNNEISWTLKEAMGTRAFWSMLICMTIPAMINTGLTFHMISIIKGKGLTSLFAASILSIVALTQLPAIFLAGFILDRVKVHYVKALNYWLLVFAMLIILIFDTAPLLIIYAVLNGTFTAFDSVSTGVLWPNYFGRKYLGSIRGFTMMAMVIGSSLGPLPFGFAFDLFNGYTEIIIAMLIFPVLGSIASFLSPAPKYNESMLFKSNT